MSVYFHGSAKDPADGVLTGNAPVWADSQEGPFGTDVIVNWAPSTLGSHVITLTATDSPNYSATATIKFDVVP